MPIIIGIIGVILAVVFWDNIVYMFGGALMLLALLFASVSLGLLREANMSNEEFYKEENRKREKNADYKISNKPGAGMVIFFIFITIVTGLGGYKVIDYNSDRIKNNQIAEKQEQEKKYEQEINELTNNITNLNEHEREIYNKYYNSAIQNGLNELEAKKSSLKRTKDDIDKENAELQKMYDDQAKYEEWIAWQEAEKKKDEEKKENENNQLNNSPEQMKVSEKEKTSSREKTFKSVTRSNEVYLGEVQSVLAAAGLKMGPKIVGVYVIPSSQMEVTKGIIFKDKGYKIRAVIRTNPDDYIGEEHKLEFYETSDGTECYCDGREEANWEKSPPLKLVYDKTNPSIWNKFKSLVGIE